MPKLRTATHSDESDTNDIPDTLKPYWFHGVDFDSTSGDQATAECLFCGKEKFTVEVKTGKARCWNSGCPANEGMNGHSFLKLLWDQLVDSTKGYNELAEDRKLLYPETLIHWDIVFSPYKNNWIVPGFNANQSVGQLYRYIKFDGKKKLVPTPKKIGHRIFGMNLYDSSKKYIYLTEGPWCGMALWELLMHCKETEDGLRETASSSSSLLKDVNVLSTPGCNIFDSKWAGLFSGKIVVIMYDSDYPGEHQGKRLTPPGYAGVKRVAKLLSEAEEPPEKILYVHWGDNGYDPELQDGHDVRDELTSIGLDLPSRMAGFDGLRNRFKEVPKKWLSKDLSKARIKVITTLGAKDCSNYKSLINTWRKALRWRPTIEDVFTSMLAIGISTEQLGDQLLLQVIGDPGSAKTKLCEAMLTSPKCYPLDHMTGFHSGWKDETGEDYSLLARINYKTLITPEGDTMMKGSGAEQIQSQIRRIFDGTSGASYKNMKEDKRYTGLRTPWIIAGTPAIMDVDQASLGDRFLKVYIDPPDAEEEQEILNRVGHTAIRSVLARSDGSPETQIEERMRAAYQETGGYVNYLRDNATDLLNDLEFDADEVVLKCSRIGRFTALLRARPSKNYNSELQASREMPTRLTHQFVRASLCVAAVKGRNTVDSEAYRVVKKLALDTSKGLTLEIVKALLDTPRSVKSLSIILNQSEHRTQVLLKFMRKIGLVKCGESHGKIVTQQRWSISPKSLNLITETLDA